MTDETFERLREFVRRNAVPASSVFPKGLPLSVIVDDEVPDDAPDMSTETYVGIRLSRADFSDLRHRIDALAASSSTQPNRPTKGRKQT